MLLNKKCPSFGSSIALWLCTVSSILINELRFKNKIQIFLFVKNDILISFIKTRLIHFIYGYLALDVL